MLPSDSVWNRIASHHLHHSHPVQATVSPRLDQCRSPLKGLPDFFHKCPYHQLSTQQPQGPRPFETSQWPPIFPSMKSKVPPWSAGPLWPGLLEPFRSSLPQGRRRRVGPHRGQWSSAHPPTPTPERSSDDAGRHWGCAVSQKPRQDLMQSWNNFMLFQLHH